MLEPILLNTLKMSSSLQSKDFDFLVAIGLIKSLKLIIIHYRSEDDEYYKVHEKVFIICNTNNIEVLKVRQWKVCRKSDNIQVQSYKYSKL